MKIIGPVDWAIILWASVSRGLLAGGYGPKPMVPTYENWSLFQPIKMVSISTNGIHSMIKPLPINKL